MSRALIIAAILAGLNVMRVHAQTPILPLPQVKAGMVGVGRTVFTGGQIDEFKAEILGVLENLGPKQSIILARLSGGPLAKTGVMQGMSGSPVYVNGRLIGAVALAFPFATEPIAGIRPIEEMLATPASAPVQRAGGAAGSGPARMQDISTPFVLGGFTRATLEHFSPQLRQMGLEPMQGSLGGGNSNASAATPAPMGNPSLLKPGAMISVLLLTGDMSAGADGTITHIDGEKVYAFGHQFLASGTTAMPFARAEVLTLLPNLSTSFKISASKELMGAITQDRNAAIAGQLGKRVPMTPIRLSLRDSNGARQQFRMEMIRDRMLSPLLLQMALYSAITGAERSFGPSTISVRGRIEFEGNAIEPIVLDNAFAGDAATAAMASSYTASPLAYVMQAGFDQVVPSLVDISIEAAERKRTFQVDQLWTTAREVRPGETLEIRASFAGENGAELTRGVQYAVPVGTPPGPLYVTLADAATANMTELQPVFGARPRTPAQLSAAIRKLRPNNRLSIRVWRQESSYPVPGAEIANPPASVGLLLAKAQAGQMNLPRGAKMAEFEIDLGDAVATGSKTLSVEVKEP